MKHAQMTFPVIRNFLTTLVLYDVLAFFAECTIKLVSLLDIYFMKTPSANTTILNKNPKQNRTRSIHQMVVNKAEANRSPLNNIVSVNTRFLIFLTDLADFVIDEPQYIFNHENIASINIQKCTVNGNNTKNTNICSIGSPCFESVQ